MRWLSILVFLSVRLIAVAQPEKLFSIHKCPIGDLSRLRTDGAYIQKGSVKYSRTFSVFFYENGTFCGGNTIHNASFDFADSLATLKAVLDNNVGYVSDYYHWGFFTISGDTVITQRPAFKRSRLVAWEANEAKYLIQNGTLTLISSKNFPIRGGATELRIETTGDFIFYPSSVKPDSTQAWFSHQEWYRASLELRDR